MNHPFDNVPIFSEDKERLRGYLRQLPEDTFRFAREFTARHKNYDFSLFVRDDPALGENGIAIIAQNSHLFGDPFASEDNPTFRVPDGAKKVHLIPCRLPPSEAVLFAGVEFDYENVHYFLGYEYMKKDD